MPRNHDPRLFKKHRSYTVERVAKTLGIHPNTVRGWINQNGLPAMKSQKPHLIRGCDLQDFLRNKRQRNKQTLPDGAMYCLGCKAARYPAFGDVETVDNGPPTANLRGLCPDCSAIMHRRVSKQKSEEFVLAAARNAAGGEDPE